MNRAVTSDKGKMFESRLVSHGSTRTCMSPQARTGTMRPCCPLGLSPLSKPNHPSLPPGPLIRRRSQFLSSGFGKHLHLHCKLQFVVEMRSCMHSHFMQGVHRRRMCVRQVCVVQGAA